MRCAGEREVANQVLVRAVAHERKTEVRFVVGQSRLAAVGLIHPQLKDRAVRLDSIEGCFVVVPRRVFEPFRQLEVEFKARELARVKGRILTRRVFGRRYVLHGASPE